jgi:hypothetical protein
MPTSRCVIYTSVVEISLTTKQNRNLPTKAARPLKPEADEAVSDDDATEDEDDLDAPPKSRSQTLSQTVRKLSPRAASSTPEELPPQKATTPPPAKSKAKGFRIGGKAKQVGTDFPSPNHEDHEVTPELDDISLKEPLPSQSAANVDSTPRKATRNFRIGGKGKGSKGESSQVPDAVPAITDRTRDTQSPSVQPPSSPPVKEPSPMVEERVETAEEKAERRRAELKRKTEEAAKKQAQSKKKKRF